MALKDCIKKMKDLVTHDDKALLKRYIDAGLSDDEAVRKLLLEADNNVLDITKRAAEAGASVANRPDFLGEIRSLQEKRADKLRAEQDKLAEERQGVNDTYGDSNTVIDTVKIYWNTLPENKGEGIVNYGLDIYDDQDVSKVLSAMLFNPNIRPNLQKGTFGLKGKTPLDLLESFKALRDNQAALRERLAELDVLDKELKEQLKEVGGRKDDDTFYQGGAVVGSMPSKSLRIKNIDVLQNPTAEQFRLFRQSIRMEYKEKGWNLDADPLTRSTWDADGNRWVWASTKANHTAMEDSLESELGVKNLDQAKETTYFQGLDVSPIGLRSGLLSAVRIMPQEKGSAAQMIAYLKKQPGVKKEELEWIGFEDWAKAKKTVTREEMILYVQENGVQVKEIQYGGGASPRITLNILQNDNLTEDFQKDNIGAVYDVSNDETTETFTMSIDEEMDHFTVTSNDDGHALEIGGATWGQTKGDRLRQVKGVIEHYIKSKIKLATGFTSRAEFEDQFQLPGGTNYREVFLTLPDPVPPGTNFGSMVQNVLAEFRKLEPEDQAALNRFYQAKGVDASGDNAFVNALRKGKIKAVDFEEVGLGFFPIHKEFAKLEDARAIAGGRFTSHAFNDVKNILAWMRVKDRIGPNGERILFVEEIQSDWHKAGREGGYATTMDKAKLDADIVRLEAAILEVVDGAYNAFMKIAESGVEGGDLSNPNAMTRAAARVRRIVSTRSDWAIAINTAMPTGEKQGGEVELLGVPNWIQDNLTPNEIEDINLWRLRMSELAHTEEQRDNADTGVPDAPFKGNAWAELTMKRVLRMAAEGSYDQVQWTTGTQQDERYFIGQVVSKISWEAGPLGSTSDERSVELMMNDGSVSRVLVGTDSRISYVPDELPMEMLDKPLKEVVGAELAEKIMAPIPDGHPLQRVSGEGLRVAEDGMKVFYDKVLVNITNKVARKLDKSAKVNKFGGKLTDSVGSAVHSLDITEEMRSTALEGQTLFQKERGSITFDEMRRGLIRLSETRDLSTFLHEAGHLYLETMRSLAEGPGAPQDIKDDWAKILKHLDIGAGREITRKHHELFAESFEKYLSLGKAPSVDMQDAFNAFKRWMELIPGKLKELAGIELPEEITGVFDRILASERQIAEAEKVQEYAAIFATPEDMGVSREIFDVYRDLAVHAHQDSVDKETKRMMDYMRRQDMAWWKTEKAKVRAEVEAEADSARVYIALDRLQTAGRKLDRDDLIKRYGKEFIKRLPKPWIYSAKGGMDAGLAAQMLGYSSADQMIQEFVRTPNKKAWIRGETTARMQDRFPDPMLDSTLSDNALKSVHNNRRAAVLAAEMRAMRAKAREDAPIVRATKETMRRERSEARAANAASLPKKLELEQIKAGARLAVGKLLLRDVRPHVYLNAEKTAGRKAFEANGRGDYQQAYMFKRQQIINHEMYRAANKAKAEGEATQRYLKKFEKTRVRQRLGKSGILDKIDTVLEGIDFRKRSLTELDYQKYLKSIIGMIEDGELVVDPDLAAQLQQASTNWQELTVQQFAGIRDVVKQLEFQAKKLAEAIVNGEKIILKEAVGEVASQLYENNKHIDVGVSQETTGDRLKKGKNQAISSWLRPSSIARVLDNAGFGAITRHVIVPMRRAYSERLIPGIHKAQKDVSDIYLKHYSRKELAGLQKRNYIEAMGEDMSKSDIISLALNWGNDGNREAVLGGVKRNQQPAYTKEGVNAALATLTERDWLFVQNIWEYMDSYWPELSAAEQRRRGIAPQKVEATPFKIRTASGKEIIVNGGYYPLAYDRRHSNRIKSQELEDLYKQMGNGVFISTSTRAGATYNRVKNHGMTVKLGLNVIDTHLREIVRDIAIGDEVNFIKRLLNDQDTQNAFHQTGNETALDTLNLWLTDAAVGELPAEGIYEQSMSWIRTGFTKSKLAWNLVTMFLQFTGIFQTAAVIGTVAYGRGIIKFSQNPRAAWKHVMATSKFMEARYSIGAFDKDVADTKAHLESLFGAQPTRLKVAMNAASMTYFLPIAKAQQVVDVTTWLAAFDKARNELEYDEQKAIYYADSQVEAAQTSGFFSDRSGLERGTLGSRKNRQAQAIRIWTTLISYMLAKGNLAYEKTKGTDFKSPAAVASYVGDLILLFTVEGMASALLYGQLPENDDDPEDWAWWAAEKTLDSALSGVPFVREIPAARFGGGNTSIGNLANDIWKFGEQISQGEVDQALVRAGINTFGTLGHLPASQPNRVMDVMWSEEEAEWYEWILGKQDK